MKFVFSAKTASIVGAAAFAALVVTAAPAAAEPAGPPLPAPTPLPVPTPAPVPPLSAEVAAQAVTNSTAPAAVEGVPHLLSPENLPPGTSGTPVTPNQPRLTYFRDLWHAMRTQEVSGSDALLLLTQRPMVADAAPTRGLPAGPQAPLPAAAPTSDAPPLSPLPVDAPLSAPLPVDAP